MNLDEDFTNYDGYDSPGEWIDSDEEAEEQQRAGADGGISGEQDEQQRAGADGGISGEQDEQQRAGADGGISGEQDEQQRAGADGGISGEQDQQRHAGADEGLDEEEGEVTPSKKELLGDVEAEWVKSERNQEKLIFRGALYTINGLSRSGDYLYARCDRRDGCTSRLWLTAGEKLLHLHTGKHNHEPKPWRPENAKLSDQQMGLIKANTDLMPVQVLERTTQNLSPTRRVYLPRKDNMARKVANKKRSILGLPATPKDFHFDIPQGLRTFSNGDLFVLHDTGKDDRKRIIVFGDSSVRPTLSSVQSLYGDGTYDRCPLCHKKGYEVHKFAQCYVLMVERESTIRGANGQPQVNRVHYPIIHALLPAHDEETYNRFFDIVKQVFPELRPTRFKSDYERSVITAVKKAYPGIKCEGDSFHFVQAVMRKLQKLGLRDRYDADYRFLHQVRLLLTPMFVPLRHVLDYWNDVVKPLITFEELDPLINYMEYTWLGKQSTGGRRGTKPQFTSELWNQNGCVVDERPRHNNHMESNNRKLQRLIKANPSVWDFMEGLRSAYKGDYNLIYQEWVIGVLTQRTTADIARDRSIFNQVSRWKDVEGRRPRLQPAEWARGMVRAMSL